MRPADPSLTRMRRLEVFGSDGFPTGAGRYLLDGDLAPHTHDFLEIALVIGGTCTHVRAEERVALGPGMVVAMRPGQWHGYVDCRSAEIFNLYLGQELLRRELLWTLDYPDLARFLLRGGRTTEPLPEASVPVLVTRLTELATRTARPHTPAAAVALGLLCCALGELATGTFDTAGHRSISPAVRQSLLVMADDPASSWTMTDLGRRVGVSVPHLHRQFTAEVGTSPMVWLARTRVELAASMLIQDSRPIGEIARRVGWPDPNYFSRRFREISGDSPTAYRRRFQDPAPAGSAGGDGAGQGRVG